MRNRLRWHMRRIRKRYGVALAMLVIAALAFTGGQPLWGLIAAASAIGLIAAQQR